MDEIIAYAGIGSRNISEKEIDYIKKIGKFLADLGCILYSGNADGADISFQLGSEGKCVLMLPWSKFNVDQYDMTKCLAKYSKGKSPEAQESIDKFHPSPSSLSQGARLMMGRNYHQIMGSDGYPPVKFVVCCGDTLPNGDVKGGTGQACRIAKSMGIPIINIRDEGWHEKFYDVLVAIYGPEMKDKFHWLFNETGLHTMKYPGKKFDFLIFETYCISSAPGFALSYLKNIPSKLLMTCDEAIKMLEQTAASPDDLTEAKGTECLRGLTTLAQANVYHSILEAEKFNTQIKWWKEFVERIKQK